MREVEGKEAKKDDRVRRRKTAKNRSSKERLRQKDKG